MAALTTTRNLVCRVPIQQNVCSVLYQNAVVVGVQLGSCEQLRSWSSPWHCLQHIRYSRPNLGSID
jgi:hypothetical protein